MAPKSAMAAVWIGLMAIQYTLWGGKASYRNTKAMQVCALIGWLALTFCASATAVFVKTDSWYAELAKPTWNPPSWLFGPIWTALYIMMALAVWLVWREGGWKVQRWPLTLYLVQWALNALWTPIFFGLQRPDLAFVDIIILLVALYATLVAFLKAKTSAAMLLVPYN